VWWSLERLAESVAGNLVEALVCILPVTVVAPLQAVPPHAVLGRRAAGK